MDEKIIVALIGGGVGLATGIVGSLFAPWANWGIEKRKQRLAYRRELIASWRVMLSEMYRISVSERPGTQGPFGAVIVRQKEWPSLQPHLSADVAERVKNNWNHHDYADPHRGILPVVSSEVGRLEKEWELV